VFAKALSTRTLGVISLLSGAAFFILLTLPYYYFPQSYIPKANPDWEYYMPKSPEAWVVLIVALSFLALSIGAFAFIFKKQSEGQASR
jgi:NADH:ubiquinone oxidoreductase subunit 3 (subunit A)